MKVDETYRMNMKNKEPEAVDSASFSEFTLPDNVDELSPFLYFKIFWDDTITQNIVEQQIYNTERVRHTDLKLIELSKQYI